MRKPAVSSSYLKNKKFINRYTKEIKYVVSILEGKDERVHFMTPQKRVVCAKTCLNSSLGHLRGLGLDKPNSIGYLLYANTVEALAELDNRPFDIALEACLAKIRREMIIGIHGHLTYCDYKASTF